MLLALDYERKLFSLTNSHWAWFAKVILSPLFLHPFLGVQAMSSYTESVEWLES